MERMKAYLLNSGTFNIVVVPVQRQYVVLGDDDASAALVAAFLAGEPLDLSALEPTWFRYAPDERWTSFDGTESRLGHELAEDDLIDLFVLKRFNFGSLVAVRDGARVQVFKRGMLEPA